MDKTVIKAIDLAQKASTYLKNKPLSPATSTEDALKKLINDTIQRSQAEYPTGR